MTRCCHILAVQYRSKGGYDMPTENSYLSDIEEILLHRHDNGGDYWATPDKRLLKGAPFMNRPRNSRHAQKETHVG